jgi:hypothetical protein
MARPAPFRIRKCRRRRVCLGPAGAPRRRCHPLHGVRRAPPAPRRRADAGGVCPRALLSRRLPSVALAARPAPPLPPPPPPRPLKASHLNPEPGLPLEPPAPPPLTRYEYAFPFLDLPALGLSTEGQRVAPLYQHMFVPGVRWAWLGAGQWRVRPGAGSPPAPPSILTPPPRPPSVPSPASPVPPAFGPTLTFIGLPWRVVPFPMFELQAKLAARWARRRGARGHAGANTLPRLCRHCGRPALLTPLRPGPASLLRRLLSGRAAAPLPPPGEMAAAAAAADAARAPSGSPPKRAHHLGSRQWGYHRWLARACGPDVLPAPPGARGAALRAAWAALWLAEAREAAAAWLARLAARLRAVLLSPRPRRGGKAD